MLNQPTRYKTSSQDQVNFLTRSKANQQLHVIISFKNRIDEKRLCHALRLMMNREPVLGCRFVELPNRTWWEARTDLDSLELCKVIEVMDDEKDYINSLMEFCIEPTDPCKDPLIRACIIRRGKKDTICLKVDHVVADGAGSKEIAYLLADTYTNLESDVNYSPSFGKYSNRSQVAFLKQAGLKKLIQYRPRTLRMPEPKFRLSFTSCDNRDQNFSIRNVSPEQFQALKMFAKSKGATINDLILTAFFRALMSQTTFPEESKLSLQLSVDLRQYLPKGHTQLICNLSSALFPSIVYQPEESFEQTLIQVKNSVSHWKSREPGLTGAMLIELALIGGYRKAKKMIGGMATSTGNQINPLLLSNFGVIDENRLTFGSLQILQAFELGPVMFGHGLMLTASTYRNQMTLAFGYCESNLSRNEIENLIEQVNDELTSVLCPLAI